MRVFGRKNRRPPPFFIFLKKFSNNDNLTKFYFAVWFYAELYFEKEKRALLHF